MAKTTLRSVTLPIGLTLHYAERGPRDGIPVILLHGYANSWRAFECAMSHLPDSLRVIALSQRGHGNSGRPVAGYRPADFAADLRDFMDRLAIPRAVIVGHSMGAAIAQRFAIDHSGRTLGLMLVGAFRRCRGNAALRELQRAVAGLADPVDPGFVRDFRCATLAGPVAPNILAGLVEESRKLPACIWREALAGLMADDCTPDLGTIAAPAEIIWGLRDAFAPRADQDALARAIPNAQLRVYPTIGHAPHWEAPGCFAQDLAVFVTKRVLPGAVDMPVRNAPNPSFRAPGPRPSPGRRIDLSLPTA